eukprot:CCRYP_007248-RA/>CCRYP_007248-RA protein AED:0.06 eAED:0.06 QI:109/1/1/1/0.75/0.6/5/958/451
MQPRQSTLSSILALLATAAFQKNVSYAFRTSPLLVQPSRVIVSTHDRLSTCRPISLENTVKLHRFSKLPRLYGNPNDDLEVKESSIVPLSPDGSNKNLLQQLHKIKQPLTTVLFSLAIFLLPLLLSSAAWAVQSGGRIGGSMGGSSRSSGGGGYRSGGSYSRGYSSGYYSRPNVVISPGITPYYSPFYSLFSWGPSIYSRPGVIVTTGPSFGGIFFFAGFFLLAALALNSMSDSVGSAMRGGVGMGRSSSVLGPGVSVAEISVALEVPDRDRSDSILNVLERLSRTARTDSRVGLQNLTSQVALELLRRKQSIVAASTKAKHFGDESKAQREFNNLSIKERGKFQRETVSKYGGVDYSLSKEDAPISPYSAKATIAVVTIVLQIDGDTTSNQLSSRVNSIRDVEEALSRIAADSKADDCLRGVEILWTPEERDETLTMRDVFADYSDLRSI